MQCAGKPRRLPLRIIGFDEARTRTPTCGKLVYDLATRQKFRNGNAVQAHSRSRFAMETDFDSLKKFAELPDGEANPLLGGRADEFVTAGRAEANPKESSKSLVATGRRRNRIRRDSTPRKPQSD